MSTAPLAGLLDSGIAPALATGGCQRITVTLREDGEIVLAEDGAPDRIGHGSSLARILRDAVPEARLACARIFVDRFACTPAAAAAGLDWLVGRGARIVNMSFGLREDRAVLREACECAAAAGVVLLGAAPARGPGVYPSSYDGVIRISGDARLAPGEISVLGGKQADFGACPRPLDAARDLQLIGGASFAVAHAVAVLLTFLNGNPGAGAAECIAHLESIARFHGPERRAAN